MLLNGLNISIFEWLLAFLGSNHVTIKLPKSCWTSSCCQKYKYPMLCDHVCFNCICSLFCSSTFAAAAFKEQFAVRNGAMGRFIFCFLHLVYKKLSLSSYSGVLTWISFSSTQQTSNSIFFIFCHLDRCHLLIIDILL